MKTDNISIQPDILGGTPVFKNTRVPVQTLIDYLRAGDTIDAFLADFPSVKRDQARSSDRSAGCDEGSASFKCGMSMKIILDECIPKKLKSLIIGYSVKTVPEMGWSGITNGKFCPHECAECKI